MREMIFSASKTCAEELQHVLEQVVLDLADLCRVYAVLCWFYPYVFMHVLFMFHLCFVMSYDGL